ncbi:MAG: Xaa-Pro peptidase family protein [Acidobacteria bacterium]|nr:Xaa-Pro peptidase family protein [Acidobacteriota bacterium]
MDRLALLLLLAVVGSAVEREPLEVFRERRERLAVEKPDGVIILLGLEEDEGRPGPSRFRQQNEFYYLTGWNAPGAAALLLPARVGKAYREMLFLPRRDPHEEAWRGARVNPNSKEASRLSGFADVRSRADFEKVLSKELRSYAAAYGVTSLPSDSYGAMSHVDLAERLNEAAGLAVQDVRPVIDRMRLIKSPGEVALIEKAIACSAAAHIAAMRNVSEAKREFQIQAKMTEALLASGCERNAYAPIVAAGANSVVLHYTENDAEVAPGDLALLDVGGEYSFYAADLTRTLPVSGRFSERQRSVYDLVLKAQRVVIAAVKPGMTLSGSGSNSLTQIARDVFEAEKRGLSRRFTHGIGHHVGLAVHDSGDPFEPLQAGMVITVEPGLYLPDERFGVRIEDMVLVTEDGARVLSAMLPSDAAEVERLINR